MNRIKSLALMVMFFFNTPPNFAEGVTFDIQRGPSLLIPQPSQNKNIEYFAISTMVNYTEIGEITACKLGIESVSTSQNNSNLKVFLSGIYPYLGSDQQQVNLNFENMELNTAGVRIGIDSNRRILESDNVTVSSNTLIVKFNNMESYGYSDYELRIEFTDITNLNSVKRITVHQDMGKHHLIGYFYTYWLPVDRIKCEF